MKLASLFTLLLSTAAFAGPAPLNDGKSIEVSTVTPDRTQINFRFGTDYVGSGDFRYRPAGDQDAYHANAQVGVSVPFRPATYFTVNAFYDRYDFGTSLAPVPTTLHKVGADIGVEYHAEGEVALTLYASPGIYGSEINSDDFNVPITGYVSYRLTPSLVAVVGARYNEWSMYQILPSGGLIWTINDQWKVRAIATAPKVEYTPNSDLTISFGGELTGGTYTTAKNEQNYPDKHLDYYDIRAGVGATYRGWKPLDLSLTAGWSFERNFRYDDIDTEYRVKGAPYVAFGARASF
ncbi:MAG: DUF6268 family outer membrane beta-barrel protein [Chthoniobacterales bacterium]